MSDYHNDRRRQAVRELWRRHQQSQAMFAVVMAGIAALFIAGIAAAFIYTKDTNPIQTVERQSAPSASAPAPSTRPSAARAPETTGSGGGTGDPGRRPPAQDPRENEQTERN
jgi:hypothetical protein